MSSYFSTIPDKDELLDILGIDELSANIISILYLSVKEEPNITELLKMLENNGISLTKNPLSERLKLLEEKRYITIKDKGREKIVKLNKDNFQMLYSNEIIRGLTKYYDEIENEVSKYTLDEMFKKFEFYSINKGFLTLYFKILFSLNPIGNKENAIIVYSNKLYDNIVDIFINELKRRGVRDTLKMLSKMEEIMNTHPDRLLHLSTFKRLIRMQSSN